MNTENAGMHSVRIEPTTINDEITFLIDIVCICGLNRLTDEKTGETSFKHEVRLCSMQEDKKLVCDCGQRYTLHPQRNHLHVHAIGKKINR